jgi:hypothetical protein
MYKYLFSTFTFFLSYINSFSQLKIINKSDFNYESIFITPVTTPLKTKGACFTIIDKRINQKALKSGGNTVINYKFKKGVLYDLFLVDSTEWGSYEHTACLRSVSFDKIKIVTIINDSVPKPFFYYCEEPIMHDNEASVTLNFTNAADGRITELSYAIDDLDKFTTERYLAPWAPLLKNKSGKYHFTYNKKEGVEKDLKLKFKFESNGIFKEKIISLKFTGENNIYYTLKD